MYGCWQKEGPMANRITKTDLTPTPPPTNQEEKDIPESAARVAALTTDIWHSPPNTPPLTPRTLSHLQINTFEKAESALKEGRFQPLLDLDLVSLADKLSSDSSLERIADFQLGLIKSLSTPEEKAKGQKIRLDLLKWVEEHYLSDPEELSHFYSYFGFAKHQVENDTLQIHPHSNLDRTLFWVDLPFETLRPLFDRQLNNPTTFPYFNLHILLLGVQTLPNTSQELKDYLESKGPEMVTHTDSNTPQTTSIVNYNEAYLKHLLMQPHLSSMQFILAPPSSPLTPSGKIIQNYCRHIERKNTYFKTQQEAFLNTDPANWVTFAAPFSLHYRFLFLNSIPQEKLQLAKVFCKSLPLSEYFPLLTRQEVLETFLDAHEEVLFSSQAVNGFPYAVNTFLDSVLRGEYLEDTIKSVDEKVDLVMERLQNYFNQVLPNDRFGFASKMLRLMDDVGVVEWEDEEEALFWFQMDTEYLTPYFDALKNFPSHRTDKNEFKNLLTQLAEHPEMLAENKNKLTEIINGL